MSDSIAAKFKAILGQRMKVPLPELVALRARLPERSRLSSVAEKFQSIAPSATRPPNVDFSATAAALINAFERGDEPSAQELTLAPWCLWNERRPLAGTPQAFRAWLNTMENEAARERTRRLRSVAAVYVEQFNPSRSGFTELASLLSRVAGRMPEPWRSLSESIALFDPERAPGRLASEARSKGTSPAHWLSMHGLGRGTGALGLSEYAYRAGLKQFRMSAATDTRRHFAAVRDWSVIGDTPAYPQHAPEMAEALVAPVEGRAVEPGEQGEIIRFLTRLMGDDPRVDTARWRQAPTAQKTLRKWLVSKSIRQFFAVVDRVAKEQHWEYRGAFWRAVEATGVINDAMVIFDDNAAAVARQIFGKDVYFAGFQKGGTKQITYGHTVLLMRVPNGVIADWSHDGPCVIWRGNDERSAPALMRPSYPSQAFQKHCNDRTRQAREAADIYDHIGSPSFQWQARVAKAISEMTGVHVRPESYRV